jgi:hypothetical protein
VAIFGNVRKVCVARVEFSVRLPILLYAQNELHSEGIVIKFGIECFYWNVTTEVNFTFIAKHGLYITCRLNYSSRTHEF